MMKPGRELDALVAEKVMGWAPNYPGGWPHPPKDEPNRKRHMAADGTTVIPAYSTDIAAAWEVVEKVGPLFGQRSFHLRWAPVMKDDDTPWLASWFDINVDHDTGAAHGRGGTAPHAICLAALKAVGA